MPGVDVTPRSFTCCCVSNRSCISPALPPIVILPLPSTDHFLFITSRIWKLWSKNEIISLPKQCFDNTLFIKWPFVIFCYKIYIKNSTLTKQEKKNKDGFNNKYFNSRQFLNCLLFIFIKENLKIFFPFSFFYLYKLNFTTVYTLTICESK